MGAGGLWVSSASTGANVVRIDLAPPRGDRAPIRGRPRPGRGSPSRGGYVWVANSRSGTVSKLDPSIARWSVDPIEVGGRPGGIDAGTSAVWVADRAAGTRCGRIDLESGEVEGAPIEVGPEPGAVAVGGDAVWVANNGDGTVTRIEP